MHPADDGALNTEEKIWDLTMTINLKGVWWGCKYAIEAMRKNPGGSRGSIINTASFVAIMGAATPQLACESALLEWERDARADFVILCCRHRIEGALRRIVWTRFRFDLKSRPRVLFSP